MMLILWYWNLS